MVQKVTKFMIMQTKKEQKRPKKVYLIRNILFISIIVLVIFSCSTKVKVNQKINYFDTVQINSSEDIKNYIKNNINKIMFYLKPIDQNKEIYKQQDKRGIMMFARNRDTLSISKGDFDNNNSEDIAITGHSGNALFIFTNQHNDSLKAIVLSNEFSKIMECKEIKMKGKSFLSIKLLCKENMSYTDTLIFRDDNFIEYKPNFKRAKIAKIEVKYGSQLYTINFSLNKKYKSLYISENGSFISKNISEKEYLELEELCDYIFSNDKINNQCEGYVHSASSLVCIEYENGEVMTISPKYISIGSKVLLSTLHSIIKFQESIGQTQLDPRIYFP